MKLFCLPYAGGSAIIYREWKPFFASNIELAPVEYAGHGKRIMHPLYKDVQAAVEDVYDMLLAAVANGRPYAIFGHSMGAMLAYEVAQKLRSNNKPLPKHIFFSGRGAPHISAEKYKIYHKMSDGEFQAEIANLGGTPKEFFEHPELMEYLLPILKNDFMISDTAPVRAEIEPFDFPITVFVGKEEEDMDAEDVHGWRVHSRKTCVVYYFNGGHFFIKDEWEAMAGVVQGTLVKGR